MDSSRFSQIILRIVTSAISLNVSLPASAAFKDAANSGPSNWTGPKFKLSQAYPTTKPAPEVAAKQPWRGFDFKNPAQAPKYMQAVLNYCLEGNINPIAPNDSFADVSSNAVRKWYHAPWLDTTASGREFIHGLTKERPSKMGPPPELGALQTTQHDNWAVGFYNPPGGYTIGQVWKDPLHPDPRKAIFPSQTVTCKFIFTATPIDEAPYLDGALEWQADVNHSDSAGARPLVHLL